MVALGHYISCNVDPLLTALYTLTQIAPLFVHAWYSCYNYNMSISKEEALQFLKQQQTAVIGTVNSNGQPSGSTVYYMIDDDFTIYFPTRATSRKYTHIQNNPKVSCTISNCESIQTVQIEGIAQEVDNPLTIARLIERLLEVSTETSSHNGRWLPPIKQLREGHFAVIAVTPHWIRIADFLNEASDSETRYTVLLDKK